jgi:hypothetical protein
VADERRPTTAGLILAIVLLLLAPAATVALQAQFGLLSPTGMDTR